MAYLMNLSLEVQKFDLEKFHAMLERGEGDANEYGQVRSDLITRNRNFATPTPLHLCLRRGRDGCAPCLRLLNLCPPIAASAKAPQRFARHSSPHSALTSATCESQLHPLLAARNFPSLPVLPGT
jgi:hypothetical protein